jgi:methylglutaconyl-CoA hydratase
MILCNVDTHGRATLTFNRPEIHNAIDDAQIAALHEALDGIAARDDVRVLVIAGKGRSFCAGADLNWMKRSSTYSEAENLADAMVLVRALNRLNTMPVPTVARVQGAAFGGGVGIVSCCDVAVASEAARFSLSEVRLGLIPAIISPYVLAAIGPRAARRYMLTAERFDAHEAHRIGLVHAVSAPEALDAAEDEIVAQLCLGGPQAIAGTKDLTLAVGGRVSEAVMADTAARIARIRATDEGREGVGAFLEKRKPSWQGEG